MSEKNKNTKKIRNFSVGSILGTLILYVIFYTAYGVVFWGWVRGCDQVHGEYKAIENGVIVEAELYDIYATSNANSDRNVHYNVMYEYIDGDIRYDGIAIYEVNEYYEAEKYLGKKIEIYIDGKGHSLPVGSRPKILTITILTVFVVVLFYPMLFWQLLRKQIFKLQEKRKVRMEKREALIADLEAEEKQDIFRN